MESFTSSIAIDVIWVSVTDGEGETIREFHTLSSNLGPLLNFLDKSELPDKTELWITKPNECTSPGPIIKVFVANLPTRFSIVQLEFENGDYISSSYTYDKDADRFVSNEISDPEVFNLPFFRSGAINRIVFSGAQNTDQTVEASLNALHQSELKPAKIVNKITVTVYL